MSQMTVPIIRQSDLPDGYCYPADPETFFEDIVDRIIGVFTNNLQGVIIDDTAPGPADRDKAWLDTDDGQLYRWLTDACGFTGWGRYHPTPPSDGERRLWVDTENNLWSYDGGDGQDPGVVTPGCATGAMWEVDHDFDARFPLAPGTLPSTKIVPVIGANSTGGEENHSLTEEEMPPHTHDFTVTANNASSGGTGELTGGEFNSPNDGHFDGTTENRGGVSDGGTPPIYTVAAHNTMPPYKAAFVIKRTARTIILPP